MPISFGVARKTLVSDARTYILLAHSTDKHVLDIGVDLGLCRSVKKPLSRSWSSNFVQTIR